LRFHFFYFKLKFDQEREPLSTLFVYNVISSQSV